MSKDDLGAGAAAVVDDTPVAAPQRQAAVLLRDYFAAHAPKRPQAWFTPTLSREWSLKPKTPSGLHEDTLRSVSNWLHDPCWDLDPDDSKYVAPCDREVVAVFLMAVKAHWEHNDALRKEETVARLIQWPYAWADAMLKERAK